MGGWMDGGQLPLQFWKMTMLKISIACLKSNAYPPIIYTNPLFEQT